MDTDKEITSEELFQSNKYIPEKLKKNIEVFVTAESGERGPEIKITVKPRNKEIKNEEEILELLYAAYAAGYKAVNEMELQSIQMTVDLSDVSLSSDLTSYINKLNSNEKVNKLISYMDKLKSEIKNEMWDIRINFYNEIIKGSLGLLAIDLGTRIVSSVVEKIGVPKTPGEGVVYAGLAAMVSLGVYLLYNSLYNILSTDESRKDVLKESYREIEKLKNVTENAELFHRMIETIQIKAPESYMA